MSVAAPIHVISSPQRRALVTLLTNRKLTRRRGSWLSLGSPVAAATIRCLADRGLVATWEAGPRNQYASLTDNGRWYAETVVKLSTAPATEESAL